MNGLEAPATQVDNLAHLIQIALTPVFLLSGIASLLNVFSTRLARVSDRTHSLTAALAAASPDARLAPEAEWRYLRQRSYRLDAAVLLGTCAGASTCAAALLMFLGSLRDATVSGLIYLCFGLALAATILALSVFMSEVLMASRGMRRKQDSAMRKAGLDPQ